MGEDDEERDDDEEMARILVPHRLVALAEVVF